uniref:Tetratricopeptide repeat protein n=1 Tax=Pseudo-nitzschia australis TaxID=44445 RepID=A0A7S4A9X3_9STRA
MGTEEMQDLSEKVAMLFTKSDILLQLDRPGEAFQALKEIEAIDRKSQKHAAKTKVLLDSLDTAAAENQTEQIGRITQQLEELKKNSVNTIKLANSGFDLYIKIAKCYEAMKDYEEAIETYNKITSAIYYDDPNADAGTPSQQRMLLMNMSRCFYHSGDYEYAIQLGKGAIEMNRHFPQVHKYVALSQKASGDLKGAVRTMGRAAMYETPWDDFNKNIVLEMYEELQREYSTVGSTSTERPNTKQEEEIIISV